MPKTDRERIEALEKDVADLKRQVWHLRSYAEKTGKAINKIDPKAEMFATIKKLIKTRDT